MCPKLKITALCSVVLIAVTSPALAQDAEDKPVAYIGAAAFVASEYPGSGDIDVLPLPYLAFNDVSGFSTSGLAIQYQLAEYGTGQGLGKWSLRFGPRVGFDFGRGSKDSPVLTGFDDVGFSVMPGGFIRGTYGPVGLNITAGQDVIGGHEGFVADVSVGTQLPLKDLTIRPLVTLSYGDSTHNNAFFGVTGAQSAASGLNVYDPGSGFYAWSVGAVGWKDIGENWQISGAAQYRFFQDRATNSPILQAPDGSDEGLFFTVALARKFDLSGL